jgi:ABC-type glutathione transport system ATPase component
MRAESDSDTLMRAEAVSRRYLLQSGFERQVVQALTATDIAIGRGQTTALLGPSGSGKSTLARCLAGLEKPDTGRIWIGGSELTAARGRRLAELRRSVQLIFQDPGTALNHRFDATEAVEEPLLLAGDPNHARARDRAAQLLEAVGLDETLRRRRVMQLSGGQRRRLLIARALAVSPQLLILDESFAGLDASLQAQLLNLLLDLREERSFAMLLISHDPQLVRIASNRVIVMVGGRVVESGATRQVLVDPQHPTTRALLASSRGAGRAVTDTE